MDINQIDQELAIAKAKAAARETNVTQTGTDKLPRVKLTDAQKAARKAAQDAERAERKIVREAAKAAKLAAKANDKKPTHMSKVQRAGEKLPQMSDELSVLLGSITVSHTRDEVNTLAQHMLHWCRVQATSAALGAKVEAGCTVKVVSGEYPELVGKTGTVVKSQRIRCYVFIEGANNRPVPGIEETGVYFFLSDVEVVAADEQVSTGTEG